MAEGGFEDFEMQDLGQKYPQYDEMNDEELDNEYQNLSKECLDLLHNDDDVKKRMSYIDRIQENRNNETSFTDNDNGETVRITTRKGGKSLSTPEIDFINTNTRPENEIIPSIEKFITDNHKEGFRFNLNSNKVIKLRLNVNKTNNNNITFKSLNIRNNERGKEKIVLKKTIPKVFSNTMMLSMRK